MTQHPNTVDLAEHAYAAFDRKLDRTASDLVARHIARRLTHVIARHDTPTTMIATLRATADELEQTGIR